MSIREKRSVATVSLVKMLQTSTNHCNVVEVTGRCMGSIGPYAYTRAAYNR